VPPGQPTVSHLVARFQLRRRASSEAFAAGVRLARLGGVSLEDVAADEVTATVRDPEPLLVRIVVDDNGLVGICPCDAGEASVCRHQVAAAHALWVRNRRHPAAD
jgi:uncharacterized Zn finger protein